MAKWHEEVYKLPKDLKWNVRPGYKTFVAERGAVRFDIPQEHTTDSYFAYVARQGFEKRRPRLEAMRASGALKHDMAEYAERLDREIRMIQQMKFSGYFLIVWDFIRYAKERGISVGPGRGSAAQRVRTSQLPVDRPPLDKRAQAHHPSSVGAPHLPRLARPNLTGI